MSTTAILIRAKELISDPEHWLQGEYAQDNCGVGVEPWDPDAYAVCAIGAVDKAAVELLKLGTFIEPESDFNYEKVEGQPEVKEAIGRLQAALGPRGLVSDFNDDPETTHAMIMDLFDRAIAS